MALRFSFVRPTQRRPRPAETQDLGRRPASPPGGDRGGARRNRLAPARSGRRDPGSARLYHQAAQQRVRRFRQGGTIAVVVAALLLLTWAGPTEVEGQTAASPEAAAPAAAVAAPNPSPSLALDEATGTVRDLAFTFYGYLPRLMLALLIGLVAWGFGTLLRVVLERALGTWERTVAIVAIARVVLLLISGVAMLSVLAGDARAVVGSVGLLGIAASWALQTPIESFTGWLLNSFRVYYRVGDRIAVGEVFGDVYRIDVLTTTVWEAGGPGKPVAAAQPTGALITFPNWEVLRSNVINYSRDFPHVWDEVTVSVANESDLAHCASTLEETARRVLGEPMQDAAREYEQLLRSERLMFDVDVVPRVYLSAGESWTDCTIRYLVPVRSRRHWSSAILLEINRELDKPEHRGRIRAVYPRQEVMMRDSWRSDDASG